MNWPWIKRKIKLVVLTRDPLKVRLGEWKADERLVGLARKVAVMPEFRMMLDVCQNEHPGCRVVREDLPPEVRAVYQGRAEGYTMALANLESMANFEPMREMPEATFEPEEHA